MRILFSAVLFLLCVNSAHAMLRTYKPQRPVTPIRYSSALLANIATKRRDLIPSYNAINIKPKSCQYCFSQGDCDERSQWTIADINRTLRNRNNHTPYWAINSAIADIIAQAGCEKNRRCAQAYYEKRESSNINS